MASPVILPRRPARRSLGTTLRAASLAVALPLLLAAPPASAALYKWTDASGRVVYSDQPPPGDVKPESVTIVTPPANAKAVKDVANKDLELKKRQAERADAGTKSAQQQAETAERAEMCARARGQMKALSGDTPMYRMNAQGERVFMDAAEKKRELERLDTMVRDAKCPG